MPKNRSKSWLRRVGSAGLVSLLALALGACSKKERSEEGSTTLAASLEVEPSSLAERLPALVKKAAEEKRRVLVYFYDDPCAPCVEVSKALARESNLPTFKNWVMVRVKASGFPDGGALGQTLEEVPFFLKLDSKGAVAGALNGAELGTGDDPHMIDAAFHEFLEGA